MRKKLVIGLAVAFTSFAWADKSLPADASGTYRVKYVKKSAGISWYSGMENPKAGKEFDFTKYGVVPEVAELELKYDASKLEGFLSGGGLKVRHCSAKTKEDHLECDPVFLKNLLEVGTCRLQHFDQDILGYDREAKSYFLIRVNYVQFVGDCDSEKGKIDWEEPFWKALSETGAVTQQRVEDLVALGHTYQAVPAEK